MRNTDRNIKFLCLNSSSQSIILLLSNLDNFTIFKMVTFYIEAVGMPYNLIIIVYTLWKLSHFPILQNAKCYMAAATLLH